MKTFCFILFCLSFLLSSLISANGQFDSAEIIKFVSGEVFVTGPSTTIKAFPNMRINQGDSIQSSANSSAGLIFEDDILQPAAKRPSNQSSNSRLTLSSST